MRITRTGGEILAPCGGMEQLKAAVLAGADAVYFGASAFSARAYAENFSDQMIQEAIKRAHFYGLSVYLALNTLIYDHEMEAAYQLACQMYESGCDALIIQDLGLLKILRRELPDLPLHASTQMNIHNVFGAAYMKELGFSRVVLAREVDIREIERIKERVDIELEVFVHGSLCVCQSGFCYMSYENGGRSGNRGCCAQPCRQDYRLLDRRKKEIGKTSVLSPGDLMTLDRLPELMALGVDSFKIEGRMKSPTYVYAVTKTYRQKRDGCNADVDILSEVANRPFTKGFLFGDFGTQYSEGQRGHNKGRVCGRIVKKKNQIGAVFDVDVQKGDIFLVENRRGTRYQWTLTEDYKKGAYIDHEHLNDARLGSEIKRVQNVALKNSAQAPWPKRKMQIKVSGEIGETLKVKGLCEGQEVCVCSEQLIMKAEKRALKTVEIIEKISLLGETPFILEKADVFFPEDAFFPVSEIKKLRRDLTAQLYERLAQKESRKYKNKDLRRSNFFKNRLISPTVLWDQGEKRPSGEGAYSSCLDGEFPYYYKFPYFSDTEQMENLREKILANEYIEGFLLRSLNDLAFCRQYFPEKVLISDQSFNLLNRESFDFLHEAGVERMTLSYEDRENKVSMNLKVPYDTEQIRTGEHTVMSMRFCPFSVFYSDCHRQCARCFYRRGYLIDRTGECYLLERDQDISLIVKKNPKDFQADRTANYIRCKNIEGNEVI